MAKSIKIHFDIDTTEDISAQLINVNNNFYTRKTGQMCGSLRFPIPTPITLELNLKAGDIVYICEYTEGFYLSFQHKPEQTSERTIKSRKLAYAGHQKTLYLCIPPFVKHKFTKEITNVQLVRPKGYPDYEWQIKFLSLDST